MEITAFHPELATTVLRSLGSLHPISSDRHPIFPDRVFALVGKRIEKQASPRKFQAEIAHSSIRSEEARARRSLAPL